MKLNGIDVSSHQGCIDWKLMASKQKLDFAIVRGGYGKRTVDEMARYNLDSLNALSIPAGIYWFSYAYTEEMAKNEALQALAIASEYKIELPIVFDFEYDSVAWAQKQGVNISKVLYNSLVSAFCSTVEKAGYYAMFYANPDYINRYVSADTLAKYDLWLAYYPTPQKTVFVPDVSSKAYSDRTEKVHIWQYSSKGFLPGIYGNTVDLNVCRIDFPALLKKRGLNHLQ